MKYLKLSLGVLIVIGGFLGMIFASKLANIRGSWQRKAETLRKDVADKRKKVVELDKIVNNAKLDLQQAVHGWERYWSGVPVDAGRQPGTLDIPLGTNHGLQQGSVLYVFQPSADAGGTVYIGPFKATSVLEARSAIAPNWRFRPGEETAWRYGQNWRIRTNIPQQHKTKFSDYETIFLRKEELLIDQQKHLQAQLEAKKNAENHRLMRQKELDGDPEIEKTIPKGENLNRFLVDGYHQAVSEAEELRNEEQAAVDELRRQAKRAKDEIERLKEANEQLARQMKIEAESPLTTAPSEVSK